MSIYEEHLEHFASWESELLKFPPKAPEASLADESEAASAAELELLQLQFLIGMIRRKAEVLGVPETASYHSWYIPEGRFVVYLQRTYPAGQPAPENLRYIRLLSQEMHETESGRNVALEEYFIDLNIESPGVRAYRGQAHDDGNGLVLQAGSPPFVIRRDRQIHVVSSEDYQPKLPGPWDDNATFEELNVQRTDASVVLGLLEKLGPVTEA